MQFARQIGIGGAAGVGKRVIECDLAVGEQQRQLRTGKAASLASPLLDLLVIRQELQLPIELAATLQPMQQTLMLAKIGRRAHLQ